MLGSLARIALAALFGVMVSSSIISKDLADKLTDSAVGYVVTLLLVAAPLLWSYLKNRYNINLFKYALYSPQGTTEQQVKDKVAGSEPPSMPA